MKPRWGRILYIGMVVFIVLAASHFITLIYPDPSLPAETFILFALTKVVADGLSMAFRLPRPVVFVEDLLKDVFYWALLAVISIVVLVLAKDHIGGAVDPAVPAVLVFLVSLYSANEG
ncbi:MAG: hypothetical protein AB1331_08750 [Bacillota bacterium]